MLWLLWLACSPPPPPSDLPVHDLAFGGDLCAGKELNASIHDPVRAAAMFARAPEVLKSADLTLVNLEGTIAGGGWLADKGEPRPILYRARPELAGLLADAGIDVVTMANNHAGDYGTDVVRETIDTLAVAGIDTVGAGVDVDAARRPVYRQVGDTVVAFVAADLTNTRRFRAREDRAGSFVVAPDEAVKVLGPLVSEARQHADLVVLTVHWGANFAREPTAETRALGAALIRAGYDAILGHSAHVSQGVELVDGKPIVYDAGNFLTGHEGLRDQATGLVFDLSFTRAGVTSVTAHGIRLEVGRIVPAPAAVRTWVARTEALGTRVDDGRVHCDPGALLAAGGPPPPRSTPPSAPFQAPRDQWVDELPPFATPLEARFANGMTLLGFRLVAPSLRQPKAAQVFDLYFRIDEPQQADLRIEVRGDGAQRDRDLHMPGDWSLGGDELTVGRILHDRSLLRIKRADKGSLEMSVALYQGGEQVPVREGPRLHDGGVWLATQHFDPDAKRVFLYPEMGTP